MFASPRFSLFCVFHLFALALTVCLFLENPFLYFREAVPIEVDPAPVEPVSITVSTTSTAVADSEVDLDGASDTLDLGGAEEEKILAGE